MATSVADDLRDTLLRTFDRVWAAELHGEPPPALEDATVLLDTGLDSLGYAIYVAELEDALGYDPFTVADEGYYPTTFGELLRFYTDHRPA